MGAKKSKREQQAELRRIYQHPLPIVVRTTDDEKGWWASLCHLFAIFPSVEVPVVSGVYDAASNSVWVRDMQDARIVWESGFFGKGSLSRSEPTWLTREVNARRHEKSGRKGKLRSLVFWLDLGTHMLSRTYCRGGHGQASSAAARL
jgi:tRNA-splicing endonuclease subunit Sen2